jgi:hypothetical protein
MVGLHNTRVLRRGRQEKAAVLPQALKQVGTSRCDVRSGRRSGGAPRGVPTTIKK